MATFLTGDREAGRCLARVSAGRRAVFQRRTGPGIVYNATKGLGAGVVMGVFRPPRWLGLGRNRGRLQP